MKTKFALLLILMPLGLLASSNGAAFPLRGQTIEFEGRVLLIGEKPPFLSGARQLTYQLAKYRIIKVTRGKYSQSEIVVDHLIFAGTELEKIKIGDRVHVSVERSKTISLRSDSPGIREASDVVKTYYVGTSLILDSSPSRLQ